MFAIFILQVCLTNAALSWEVRYFQPGEESDMVTMKPPEKRLSFIFPVYLSSTALSLDMRHFKPHLHFEEMIKFIKDSVIIEESKKFIEKTLRVIGRYPGTKWCGSGNVSDSFNDLGSSESTDRCCREHDSCEDVIEAGQSAHNLTNNDVYTKLNCNCDQVFLDCLRADTSKTSYSVAFLYFNVLNTQCFKEDHPIIQCAEFYPLSKRCKEYKKNMTAPKVYQFFDVPLFLEYKDLLP